MSQIKSFCLKCYKTNVCECGTTDFIMLMAHKNRPPRSPNGKINKNKWHEFLRKSPTFVNCVPEELYDRFNDFILNKVKFPDGKINGRELPLRVDNEK